MKVNTDIYGTAADWVIDTGFNYNTSAPAEYCFKRGKYTDLKNYVDNSVLTAGQPIDYSICYAAQAKGLPLSKMRTWFNNMDTTVTEYTRNKETGWFFGHGSGGFSSDFSYINAAAIVLQDNQSEISTVHDIYWLPDGVIKPYPNQLSQQVIPIVEFNPHAAYFAIEADVFNKSSAQVTTYTLKQLQDGTFTSNDVIIRAYGTLYTRRSTEADYTPVADDSSNYCGVCLNTPLEFKNTNINSMAFLSYAMFLQENIPLYGWADRHDFNVTIDGQRHRIMRFFATDTLSATVSHIFIDTLETTYNVLYSSSYGYVVEGYAAITPANLEKLRRCAAAYGLFFTEGSGDALKSDSGRWTNNDMFLGTLENGIAKGDYTRGAGNVINPLYNITSSQQTGYYPYAPNIYIGDKKVNNIFIGDQKVIKAYMGDQQL